MTAPGDPVIAGRAAWARLCERDRKAWADWVAVGHALKIGRDAALQAAHAKTPHGKIYTRIFGDWLRANGLDDIGQQVRYRILVCIDNLPAIEKWRGTLEKSGREKFNHPDSVYWHWQRSVTAGKTRAPLRRAVYGSQKGAYPPRPPAADQDLIRKVAAALRENWCNDTFKLAAIAIKAIYETSEPPAKPAPRRIAEKNPLQAAAHAA